MVKILVNMQKARDIWREKMRKAREPLLAALDVEFQRDVEDGKDTKPTVAKKKALRDVTADPAIEAAQTPEELVNVWPTILGPKEKINA